ncbi:MAG: fatty acid desaturase, partial [Paracoccaceae bacterium]
RACTRSCEIAPMDHKTVLARLSPAQKAALTLRSDRAGLIHLAGHAGAVLATGTLIATGAPFWPVLLPVQGILLVFLFTLEHECTHKTPFANETLNEWIGRGCGLILIQPFEWFRYFHLAHHRYTNIDGQDPELASEKPQTRREWLIHVSGLPFWAAMIGVTLRLALNRERAPYLPDRALPRMRREAIAMLCLNALGLTFAAPLLFWVWIVPALLGQPFLRLYLLAEHGDCPRVANMLENTRTTFTTGLVRFLAWNMPYHAEHHVYPAVPFHRLPQFHAVLRDHLKVTADGYVAFTRDYLARRP